MKPKNRPRTKNTKTVRVKRQPHPNDQKPKEETKLTKEELIAELKKRFGRSQPKKED